jgi:hypothetical protein
LGLLLDCQAMLSGTGRPADIIPQVSMMAKRILFDEMEKDIHG